MLRCCCVRKTLFMDYVATLCPFFVCTNQVYTNLLGRFHGPNVDEMEYGDKDV